MWLISHRKSANADRLPYKDAVEEALCFGWIDATVRSVDERTYKQWFCPRKAMSVWSKPNKVRVERLVAAGLVMPAGQAMIDLAKSNGQWNRLDAVDALTMPDDLAKALRASKGAREYYDSLSPSARKMLLYRIHLVKRPETRAKKIAESVQCCVNKQSPAAFFFPDRTKKA